jgi:hypothetical protein
MNGVGGGAGQPFLRQPLQSLNQAGKVRPKNKKRYFYPVKLLYSVAEPGDFYRAPVR